MSELRNTLNERGSRYGRFDAHAGCAEAFIAVAMGQRNWQDMAVALPQTKWWGLAADQRHAIRYILDKLARILEGDPDYTDNWHDIAGYATLIEDRLNGTGLYAPTTLGDAHAPDCARDEQDAGNPR